MSVVFSSISPEIQLDLREAELNRRESALTRREIEISERERNLRDQVEAFHRRFRRAELIMTQSRADRPPPTTDSLLLKPLRVTPAGVA
jgi:hypothetical protein